MADSSDNIAKWIQDLTRRSVEEQIRSMQRYTEMIQRVSSGELDESSVREEYMRFARQESLQYARQLTSLSLRYYNDLVDIYRAYNDHFFRLVFGGGNGETPQAEQPAPTPRRVEMSLHAPLGQVAQGSFVLENKRPEGAEISFLVSEFAERGSEASFRPPLHIQPPRFQLEPNQEVVVSLSLGLLPQLFKPGVVYRATIVVRGYDDLELVLKVWADPGEAQVDAPQAQAASPEADDLTRIAGIGPAYAEKLSRAGIDTFERLGSASDADLVAALGPAGLQRAARGLWREQASLAAQGDWDQVQAIQASLNKQRKADG